MSSLREIVEAYEAGMLTVDEFVMAVREFAYVN